MKNTFKAFIALFMVAGLWSCEDDDNFMIAEPQEAEFALLTPDTGSSIVITEGTTQSNVGATFTWEDVDYGTPTEVTYTLEAAPNGTDFATVTMITSSSSRIHSMTYAALQTLANTLDTTNPGELPIEPVAIDFRVKSTIGAGAEAKYSNVLTLGITPFIPTVTEIPKLYVVGGFLAVSGYGNDWTPGDAVPLAALTPTSTDYEGYVFFNSATAEYKFLPTNSSFEGDYGDTGPTNGSYSGTLEQTDEVNAGLPTPTAGYYRVRANIGAAMTYSVDLTSWGIIGSATPTGWDSDTDMVYDPATKKWTITMDLIGGQKIKFRANDAWDVNFGDDGQNGSLEYGAADIDVATSGNYTITLDLSVPREYTYTVVAN